MVQEGLSNIFGRNLAAKEITRHILLLVDAAQGIEAEVIDLATLKPYDADTVLASVMRTGRCVIVHEAARTGGFGAEIAALIAERGLTSLLAPVVRVTGYDTVMPLPRLEQRYIPSVSRIVAATRKTCEFS